MSQLSLRQAGSHLVAIIPADVVKTLRLVDGQTLGVMGYCGGVVMVPMHPQLEPVRLAHDRIAETYHDVFQRLDQA